MSGLPEAIDAALVRASREQIHIGREARELELSLQRFLADCGDPVDPERLLGFVAEVRLASARTGGDLCEILLQRGTPAPTDGGMVPMVEGSVAQEEPAWE